MANMLSKSELKELKALHQKKYRSTRQEYLVEGDKLVYEAISSNVKVSRIFALSSWNGIALAKKSGIELVIIDERQLDQLCELKNPNQCAAIVSMPMAITSRLLLRDKWNIFLDRLRDPGNLGTIMRIADWYGIDQIICSEDSVEQYNQKVIQASMGAIFRIPIVYVSKEQLLDTIKEQKIETYAAIMNGKSIRDISAPKQGLLMMGNEAQGLDNDFIKHANQVISIPGKGGAESLNVAVATGILVDWINRA